MSECPESLLCSAYANIGLDANTTWREGPGDGYHKGSDRLWVKLNYLKEKKHHQVGKKGKVVTVREVIPQSRLAHYGNYPYDNDREMMYNREKPSQCPEDDPKPEVRSEPWMLPEVEREFRRLTRNCSQPYDLYNGFKPVDVVQVDESIKKQYPVLAKRCQPNVIDPEDTLETIPLPNPFYRIDDLNQLELQMRITSTKQIWEHSLRSPTVCGDGLTGCPGLPGRPAPSSQQEPSADRRGARIRRSPPLPPPTCHPVADPNSKKAPKTSSTAWEVTESKSNILPVVKKRSSNDGHDFTNLTLLTRPVA